uniref:Stress up-regulated Nod 19 n=1 Tax=Chenopodium quinoa TaxID=63459 RepID=A0A803MXP3_CHEQI
MVKPQQSWLYCLALFLAVSCEVITGLVLDDSMMKSADYLSPEFAMKPGSVVNKFYYNIDFPKGHIGIKDFNAEVVDEAGNFVSLQDTYLHHWVVVRYYVRKGLEDKGLRSKPTLRQGPDFMVVRNTGVCKNLGQYFGLGSETRKTVTHVPDPYAIEVGNPDEVPEGFEERWLVNVHAIDTRGVVDRLGCTECRCSLYNSTIDEYGRPISPDYEGDCIVAMIRRNVEYEVSPCDSSTVSSNDCIDNKRISFNMPRGGYLVYGVAHQHAGGIGSALYRKDGQAICSSIPTYGQGNEVGNESGYIVGMSTCYPDPGSIKINDGETLVLESNYSSSQKHTGVMGLFYILVSEQLPRQKEISTF